LHIYDDSECGNEPQILEFPIFSLANDLHTPYSTLYLSTVNELAKWTIATGFSASPLGRAFPDNSGKATLRAED
jgi:hypothetical protein